jgi:hypothetical protein
MMMNRRGLLLGLGSLLAAPAIVKISSIMPVHDWTETLYGDGIHNDIPALAALLRGQKVRRPWGGGERISVVNGVLSIPEGIFYLPQTSIPALRSDDSIRKIVTDRAIFKWNDGEAVTFAQCEFQGINLNPRKD